MGESGMIHDFSTKLKESIQASDEPFWDAIYKKSFPNMVNHMLADADTQSQRMGIDRVILLANGKTIFVDEKKRTKIYDDILLEYISVSTTNAPGWIEKDLAIDYLAYAFMPNKTVYMFPWNLLRRAWLHYKPEWMVKYPIISALNKTYTTYSVAIPINTVRDAVNLAMVIQLEGAAHV